MKEVFRFFMIPHCIRLQVHSIWKYVNVCKYYYKNILKISKVKVLSAEKCLFWLLYYSAPLGCFSQSPMNCAWLRFCPITANFQHIWPVMVVFLEFHQIIAILCITSLNLLPCVWLWRCRRVQHVSHVPTFFFFAKFEDISHRPSWGITLTLDH